MAKVVLATLAILYTTLATLNTRFSQKTVLMQPHVFKT